MHLIESGKVKEVGVSNFRPHGTIVLLQSAMKSKLVTNQIEISLAATQGFTNGDIAFHQERSTTFNGLVTSWRWHTYDRMRES